MNDLRFLENKILFSHLFRAASLDCSPFSKDHYLNSISSFAHKGNVENLQFTTTALTKGPESVTFAPSGSIDHHNIIKVADPKCIFFKTITWLERNVGFKPLFQPYIANTAKIDKTAVVSDQVSIGEGSIIGAGVVIYSHVKIGDHCIVEANTVLGSGGFGVVREQLQSWMIPHIGGVIIGDNVRFGALTTVDRASIGYTTVGNFTKVDDRVHIAHNCKIGERNIICAGASIGGSVSIGDDCWLGLGCNIKQKVSIANGTIVGIGANVFTDTGNHANMFGYPAKKMPR